MSKKGYILMVLTAALVASIIIFGSMTVMSSARSGRTAREKHYVSHEIHSGESLWSIAADRTEGWDIRPADYVSEVMSVNGMSTDQLISGDHIIVIVYQ